jgi:circadian clock protein KaiC
LRFVNACKKRGVTVFLINQAAGFSETQEVSGMGFSSLVDTVLAMRYVEGGGEVNRVLMVMKARGSKHSNQYREFLITDNGIEVTDVYVGDGGLLTGTARQEREARDAAERLLKHQEVEHKQKELARMRAAFEAENARRRWELAAAELEIEQLKAARDVLGAGHDERGRMRGEDRNSKRLQSRSAKRERRASGGKRGAK